MDEVKMVAVGGSGTGLQPGELIEAKTMAGVPNIAVEVIGPGAAVLVRFLHLFGLVWLALMTTGGVTGQSILPWGDFSELATKCAYAAAITAGMGAAKDIVTLLGKLEQRFPFLTGNV